MTYHDDTRADDAPQDQPTMELLEGTEAAPANRPSMVGRVVRGSLYGMLLLTASALLAISAVPELAHYASFIPDSRDQGKCHLSSGSCATLDMAALKNVKGSPCCPLQAAMAAKSEGCSSKCDQDLTAVSLTGIAGEQSSGCCQQSGSCCDEEGVCPLTLAAAAGPESVEEQSLATAALASDALAKLPTGEKLGAANNTNVPPAPPVAQ